MIVAIWLCATFVWIAAWILSTAVVAAVKEGEDAEVSVYGTFLPAFCALTCLFCFIATPRNTTSHAIILWIHHAAIISLFVFLSAAQYLQVEASIKFWKASSSLSIAATYRRLHVLAAAIIPGAAVTILLTGLRLIWDAPNVNSPANLWLTVLLLVFAFAFWDGIMYYVPITRKWDSRWGEIARNAQARPNDYPAEGWVVDTLRLLLHFLSWPILFLVGIVRPDSTIASSLWIAWFTARLHFLSEGWPEVVVAVTIWLCMGLILFVIRYARLIGWTPPPAYSRSSRIGDF